MDPSHKPIKEVKTKIKWQDNLQCPGKRDCDIVSYCYPTGPHTGLLSCGLAHPATSPSTTSHTRTSDPSKPHSGLLGTPTSKP